MLSMLASGQGWGLLFLSLVFIAAGPALLAAWIVALVLRKRAD